MSKEKKRKTCLIPTTLAALPILSRREMPWNFCYPCFNVLGSSFCTAFIFLRNNNSFFHQSSFMFFDSPIVFQCVFRENDNNFFDWPSYIFFDSSLFCYLVAGSNQGGSQSVVVRQGRTTFPFFIFTFIFLSYFLIFFFISWMRAIKGTVSQ